MVWYLISLSVGRNYVLDKRIRLMTEIFILQHSVLIRHIYSYSYLCRVE